MIDSVFEDDIWDDNDYENQQDIYNTMSDYRSLRHIIEELYLSNEISEDVRDTLLYNIDK